MRVKFSHIILLLALCAFGLPNMANAQEGELGEEKEGVLEVVVKDSILSNGEQNIIEEREQSDGLPVGPMPQFNLPSIPVPDSSVDKDEKGSPVGNGEKAKTEEAQPNLSFNFIYYLFYKFKLVDATDG